MADHPNAAMARRLIDSLNRRDYAAMSAALSDDIVWHEIGSAEPRRGKAALATPGGAPGRISR